MDLEQYWQFGAALVFVLALIGVLFFVLQRLGGGAGRGRRGSRLGVVEAAVVDKRRRLVLVRRDGVEHLVMIGGPQDVVIESGITKREPSFHAEPETGGMTRGLDDLPKVAAAPLAAAAAEPRLSVATDPEPAPQLDTPVQVTEVDPAPHELPSEDQPPQYRPASVPEPQARPAADEAHSAEPETAHGPRLVAADAADSADAIGAGDAISARDEAEASPPHEEAPPTPGSPGPTSDDTLTAREAAQAAHGEPGSGPAQPTHEPAMPAKRAQPETSAPPREAAPEADQPPWPPSEGRFREAQRRFAERSSEQAAPPRASRDYGESAYGPHHPADRRVASRAVGGSSGAMMGHDRRAELTPEASHPAPANLNVRPGEDR